VHPSPKNNVHELYLLCDNVDAFLVDMREHGIACDPIEKQEWGLLTRVLLPGGGKLGVYQPLHARPTADAAAKP
jgi:hypothetical protein